VRQRGFGVGELPGRMRVAVQREDTPGSKCTARQTEVQVLTRGIAVDLDGDARLRSRHEHGVPVRLDPGACARDAAPRVGQDVDGRIVNGSDEPRRLIFGATKLRVRRREHQLEM
jgi:hypothetical protein